MASRFAIAASVWTLFHAYIWQRLFATTLSGSSLALAAVAMLVLAWLPLASFVVMRRKPSLLSDAIEGLGFTGLAFSSLLVVFTLATDVLLARLWLDPRTVTVGVLGGALAIVLFGA